MEDFIDFDFLNVKSIIFQGKTVLVAEAAGAVKDQTLLAGAVYDPTTGTRPKFAALPFPDTLRLGGGSLITVPAALLPFDLGTPGQWQLVCDSDYLYLLRAVGIPKTKVDVADPARMQLLANRYTLVAQGGGKTNDPTVYAFMPFTETRFKKSGLKETPADKQDLLSAKDGNGKLFLEPVLQLNLPREIIDVTAAPSGTEPDLLAAANGFFTACITPGDTAGQQRWLFVTAPPGSDGSIMRATSLLQDADRWPDLMHHDAIVVRDMALADHAGNAVKLHGTPAGILFQRQEQIEAAPSNSLTGPRMMVSARSLQAGGSDQLVCFDLALAANGTPVLPNPKRVLPVQGQLAPIGAIQFSGSDEWLESDADLEAAFIGQGDYSFTIEAWLRCNAGTNRQTIFSRAGSVGKDGIDLYIDEGGKICLTVGVSNADSAQTHGIQTADKVDLTDWHHVAATCFVAYSETQRKGTITLALIIDKTLVSIVAPDKTNADPTYAEFDLSKKTSNDSLLSAIGMIHIGGSPFDGDATRTRSFAEVRYWGAVHQATDIPKYMNTQIDVAAFVNSTGSDDRPVGYWRLDGPWPRALNGGLCSTWAGRLTGGAWISGPPALKSIDDNTQAPSAEDLSCGMGALAFLGPVKGDPSLLSGADGKIHLYFGQNAPSASDLKATALQVAHYDTTQVRAGFTLAVAGIDVRDKPLTGTPAPTLSLSARHVGSAYNTATAALSAAGDLVFTYQEGSKDTGTETFKNVPTEPEALSHVINGTASDDPLNPKVRSGDVPYYQYDGTGVGSRSVVEVETGGAPLLFIDPKPLGKLPRALTLASVTVTAAAEDKIDLLFTFLGQLAAQPALAITGLPSDAKALRAALGRHDLGGAKTVWMGPPVKAITAGRGQILAIGATTIDIAGNDNDRSSVRTVTMTGAGFNDWSDKTIPSHPGGFIDAINAKKINAVLIGSNTDRIVPAQEGLDVVSLEPGLKPKGPLIDLGALFCVVGPDVTGAVSTGVYGVRAPQGYTAAGSLPTRAQQRGSVLFAATGVTAPAGAQQLTVQPGLATCVQEGSDGGWVIVPPVFNGDFSKAPATSAETDAMKMHAPQGDYTFESWVRSEEPGNYDLIAARSGANLDLAATLVHTRNTAIVGAAWSEPFAAPNTCAFAGWIKIDKGQNLPEEVPLFTMYLDDYRYGDDQTKADSITLKLEITTDEPAGSRRIVGVLSYSQSGKPGVEFSRTPLVDNEEFFILLDVRAGDHEGYCAFVDSSSKIHGLTTKPNLPNFSRATIVLGADDNVQRAFRDIHVFTATLTVTGASLKDFPRGQYPSGPEAPSIFWNDIHQGQDEIVNALGGPEGAPSLHIVNGRAHAYDVALKVSAGGQRYATEAFAVDDPWTHVAVAAPQTYAIALNTAGSKKDGHLVKDGDSIAFQQAIAVDGVVDLTGFTRSSNGINVVLSTLDYSEPGTVLGYWVYFDWKAKTLCFGGGCEGAPATGFLFSYPLPDLDDHLYFAVSAHIACEKAKDEGKGGSESPDIKITFTQTANSANLTSQLQYTTTLYCSMTVSTKGTLPSSPTTPVSLSLGTTTKQTNYKFLKSGMPLVIGGYDDFCPRTPDAGEIGLCALRLWTTDISDKFNDLAFRWDVPAAIQSGLAAAWRFREGSGTSAAAESGSHEITLTGEHVWKPSTGLRVPVVHINGNEVGLDWLGAPVSHTAGITLGGTVASSYSIAEARLWSEARSDEQIADNMNIPLSGSEDKLAFYWPLSDGAGTKLAEQAGGGVDLTLSTDANFWKQTTGHAPPVGDELPAVCNALGGSETTFHVTDARGPAVCGEYGAIVSNAAGNLSGVQRRGYAYLSVNPKDPAKTALAFRETFKVGDADLIYMGQVQTAPSIIGYIEGAPPVPMENLTRPYYTSSTSYSAYDGITSVSFAEATQVTYSYSTTGVSTDNAGMIARVGLQITAEADGAACPLGLGFTIKAFKAGAETGTEWRMAYASGTQTVAADAQSFTDSSVTTLALRGNWEPKPQDGDERRYVPANTGMALVRSGIADVYGLRLKQTGTLAGLVLRPEGDASIDYNLIHFPIDPTYTKQGTLDGKLGFANDPDYPDADTVRGSYFQATDALNHSTSIGKLDDKLESDFTNAVFATTPDKDGNFPHSDFYKSDTPDFGKFSGLGNLGKNALSYKTDSTPLPARPGERDLMSTYVWTAAGGLQIESKTSAISRNDTYAAISDFRWDWNDNIKVTGDPGPFVEGTAFLGHQIVMTVQKARNVDENFSIQSVVDCESFLANWPYQGGTPVAEPDGDVPAPGKVDAYRFKTFYLAPTTGAYDYLYNQVIDPVWLANSNTPDAVALRQVQNTKNTVWRVFHRVTYVSRVAPKVSQNPSESTVKIGSPVINLTANGGLALTIANETGRNSTARTIADLLDTGIAAIAPWWGTVVTAAPKETPPGPNAATYLSCSSAAQTYFGTYFSNLPKAKT